MDQQSKHLRIFTSLKDTQVLVGQRMILVAKIALIKRKEFLILEDKSIFARSQLVTFGSLVVCFITHDLTFTSNQNIGILL